MSVQPTAVSTPTIGRDHVSLAQAHSQRVHDQFVELHEIFDRSPPSAPFRRFFDETIGREIAQRLASGSGPVRILEVGCGVGNWAEEIHARFASDAGRIEYLGIDFAEPCVASCNQRLANHPKSRAIAADFESLPPDGGYDLVLFIEVFCHLRAGQDDAWVTRAKHWLAQGGVIGIIDKERYSKHGWRVRWDLFKRAVLPATLRGRPYYFPENYNTLLTTLRYPSFSHLARVARRIGLSPRSIAKHGLFTALLVDQCSVALTRRD